MIETILVPTDGSDHAKAAVTLAADLSQKYGAKVIVLHVMKVLGSERIPDELRAYQEVEHVRVTERDMLKKVANEIVAGAKALAHENQAAEIETLIEVGDPAASILKAADSRNVDLIVMGSRGLSDLKGLLMGSVSHKVSQLSACACLTVK